MGYYTTYQISVSPAAMAEEVIAAVEESSGYSDPFGGDSIKWYNHDSDMKGVSKRFPDVEIALDGEGEENGDVWRKWYRNGDVQEWRRPVIPAPKDPPKPWWKA